MIDHPASAGARLLDMADSAEQKATLHRYLQAARDALVWKLDGLSERDVRLPRTPSGNNLLGILKHCLNVEVGYFGPTFGRAFPTPHELVPEEAFLHDPQSDWYAGEDESKEAMIDLARRAWTFADRTIDELPLTAPGRVPWWPPDRQEVTLQRIMVHVTYDLARHAGQADIMREQVDAAIGCLPDNTNIPDAYDWPAYVDRLTALADRFT
jgi:uncharacterized damage-inducible protein DinB